jgi:7-cyano-7-deazaguanine tRNA-ribosyltransferase
VDVDPLEIANFEEKIGSDIAIILDKPTGLDVTRKFAEKTISETLLSARKTLDTRNRDDIIWTLPVQGGKYLDLVSKSAKASAKLDYGCYALGSPVEVMESYDFPLLVKMILASKPHLPSDRPFHLFGAGHPLIIPLAIALGCDMFDSASYILFAKNDRYISSSGTIRLEKLEHLPCNCKTCSSLNAQELKVMKKEERVLMLARHNLSALKLVIEETKQAIWEERLWEYVRAKCSNHPSTLEAFFTTTRSEMPEMEIGTPRYKERGIFLFDDEDLKRPEVTRHWKQLLNVNLAGKDHLVIAPETKTKPFLNSDIFKEILDIVDLEKTLICYASPIFGLVPAEISDIFPISQVTHYLSSFPSKDQILNAKSWKRIDAMMKSAEPSAKWLKGEFANYSKRKKSTIIEISKNYKSFKKKLGQV